VVDVKLLLSECDFAILDLVQILFVSVGAFFYWMGGNVLLDGDYLLCFLSRWREILWCCGRVLL
jgi:hypothetical protein